MCPRPFTCLVLTLLASFASQPIHAQDATANPAGEVDSHVLTAQGLQHNRVGDSPQKRVLVYTPPGYDRSETRYPTIYLLHGIFGSPEEWTGMHGLAPRFDAAIAEGRLAPALVVMPHGMNPLGGGYYRDSPITGDWGTFIAEELVEWVDTNYRSLAQPDHRAIAGHSMGGYGAIHHLMHHRDVFSVAYAMSPCCLAPVADLGQGNPSWQALMAIENWDGITGAMGARDLQGLYTVALAGLVTAWATNSSESFLGVDLPFIVRNGETMVGPAHADWARAFPTRQIEEHLDALRSAQGIALDYGILDQFAHIPEGTQEFVRLLTERRVPVWFEAYEGDHRDRIGERLFDVVLPFILERLAPQTD